MFVGAAASLHLATISDATVDALAAGLLALGLEPGDRIGIWSPNRWEWLVTQFATARIGADPRQHQPGLPARPSSNMRCNKVGCRALVTRRALQELRLSRHARRAGARARRLPSPAGCRPQPLPRLEIRHPHGRRAHRPACSTSTDVLGARRPGRARAPRRGSSAALEPDDADQHPVHLRHHRRAEGRDADPPQHRQQRQFRHRGDAARARRPAVHPGAALPLLRHGDGHAGLRHQGRDDGVPGRGLRPRRDADGGGGRALHRALRRADHVRRHARPSATSRASTSARCAPASWPARPARSR